MEVLKTFRHENKYRINKNSMYNIRDKLSCLLNVDRSIDGYTVRSLYFDSVNDVDYYDKLAGACNRKKIRLRLYDGNINLIKLEIKGKYDTHQLKKSLIIDKKTAVYLIHGYYEVLLYLNNDVALEIYDIMRSNCYRPKCIIEYDRLAFTSNSNTRITMDYNVRKSDNVFDFLIDKPNFINLTNYNEVILEIKFDRFLEPYIGNVLKGSVNGQESISKYVMGRNM